ncbi:MAG: hypothetical protein JWM47_3801 [Acidimicrobiales bacterium]|nr:hypothetical protein [Acidimicrobiales bacterium]
MTDVDGGPVPGREDGPAPTRAEQQRRWLYVAAAVLSVLIVVVAAIALSSDDDDDDVVTAGTSTTVPGLTSTTSAATTSTPATSSTSTTATTSPPTTVVAPSEVDHASIVWPDAASSERFTEPVPAARGFAETYLGFEAPVVGAFQAGDARSGEVEVRPRETGPVTTILVRQFADDAWYVLGAATANIALTEPVSSATITSPVTLRGLALAFEGSLDVEVRRDGSAEPVGEGVVTGGGDVMRPFEGSVEFDAAPGGGAIVVLVHSAEDGQVWEAAVVRVRLADT